MRIGGNSASPDRKRLTHAIAANRLTTSILYDKPYEDKSIVRVAGPFTVESLSPHRELGVDENDELIGQRWLMRKELMERSKPISLRSFLKTSRPCWCPASPQGRQDKLHILKLLGLVI